MRLVLGQIERHEYRLVQAGKFFFGHQVHAPRRARPANLQMMKGDRRLNHRLQEKFFVWRHRPHPAFFPGIVRGVKFTGVVKIDARDVLDWISNDMFFGVGRCCRLHQSYCIR